MKQKNKPNTNHGQEHTGGKISLWRDFFADTSYVGRKSPQRVKGAGPPADEQRGFLMLILGAVYGAGYDFEHNGQQIHLNRGEFVRSLVEIARANAWTVSFTEGAINRLIACNKLIVLNKGERAEYGQRKRRIDTESQPNTDNRKRLARRRYLIVNYDQYQTFSDVAENRINPEQLPNRFPNTEVIKKVTNSKDINLPNAAQPCERPAYVNEPDLSKPAPSNGQWQGGTAEEHAAWLADILAWRTGRAH